MPSSSTGQTDRQARDRLREIFSSGGTSEEKIRAALRLGAERLGTQFGQLARIDPRTGTHLATEVASPEPASPGPEGLESGPEPGDRHSLSKTFCRKVLSEEETLAVQNAPEEGWEEDPAYKEFGLACYLGTKVVAGGDMYGTVCFSGTEPRDARFGEPEESLAELIAHKIGQELERARRNHALLAARRQIRSSEDLLEQMEKVADVGGWQLDVQNRSVHWTGEARRLLGIEEKESTLGAFVRRVRGKRQEDLQDAILRSVRKEEPFTLEVALKKDALEEEPLKEENGSAGWVEIHGEPRAKEERVTRVAGTIRDITGQRRRLEEVERARRESVLRLARAAERRDFESGEHVQRVGEMSEVIASALGQPSDWAERLGKASILHDVGKIGIPDKILLKEGPLTDEEQKEMQKHTLEGADLLAGGENELIQMARGIARHHHERWDGDGYPDGLEGTAIPLPARIVAVADALDVMTSDRPYRKALSPEKAFAEVKKEAGVQFDPQVAEAALGARGAITKIIRS